jgi:hypothetical protein
MIKIMTLKVKNGYINRGFPVVCSCCGKVIKIDDRYHRKRTGSPENSLRCVSCAKRLNII